jgi:hypothetical protein
VRQGTGVLPGCCPDLAAVPVRLLVADCRIPSWHHCTAQQRHDGSHYLAALYSLMGGGYYT